MKKFLVFFAVVSFFILAFSESFPSLDSKYVFGGISDLTFSDLAFSLNISHSLGNTNLSGNFKIPFNFNFDLASFTTSLGFQLIRSESFLFLGYLNFGKFKDYALGISGLFSNPTDGIDFYSGAFYTFGNVPILILDAGLRFKIAAADVTLGGAFWTDFKSFLLTKPVGSIDIVIGSFLLHLGYQYQPLFPFLGLDEKHTLSVGIGFAPKPEIRYSVTALKRDYFEDEKVNINVKRLSSVPMNVFGKIGILISDQTGKEVLKKEYNISQENISLSESLKSGTYKITLYKVGNFELVTENKAQTSFIVKGIPKAKVDLPSVVNRKKKYEISFSISSVDSYPSNISVKLDEREISSQSGFIPNRVFKLNLSFEELGKHQIEVFADGKKIGQHLFEVRNEINAEWINRPQKLLTLQEITVNPPLFKFSELIGDLQEPYANQEVKFLIRKEGEKGETELFTFTDKNGMASIPFAWESGVYLIEVQPSKPEYSKITFSGQKDYIIRIEPNPKEMVLQTEDTDGIYIDTLSKTILLSKDRRNFRLSISLQDELGDPIESGFLKVSMLKVGTDNKLKDVSQDFNLTDKINIADNQDEFIDLFVNVSPKVETGEYYLFFEIFNDSSKEAQSRWVDVYKVILYKDALVVAENITVPGIVKKDVVIEGEPNKLKLIFMWKDGEPIRNAKVSLRYLDKNLEGYTNNEGEMIILTPEPQGYVFELNFSILYNNFDLISGTKKIRIEQMERIVQIPSGISISIGNLGIYKDKVNLLMNRLYDFSIKNIDDAEIIGGRTTGYNIVKMLNEVLIPIEPSRKAIIVNLMDEQKNLLKIKYSVYGIFSNEKGKEYFLGTFTSGTSIQLPISTKIQNNHKYFDEFVIIPDGEYFAYRFTSANVTTINAELRTAKRLSLEVKVEDDEGRVYENPARYSIYYKERGVEYYVGAIMSGLSANISIPSGFEIKDIIDLLRVYREGYQINFDVEDVVISKTDALVTLPVRIVNQQDLVSDFSLELTIGKNKVDTPYEIIAHSPSTFYGIPLYSKTVYEKGRGKNYYGPGKNFNLTIHLSELGLNTYIEGVEISSLKSKLPIEIAEFADLTLCQINFEEIQYPGAKATIKVDGRPLWRDVINKNAIFPVPDGVHTIEIILDKYALPIKIVKDFKKSTLGEKFMVTLTREVPNIPPYMLKDVLYYPKEDSSYKLYKMSDETYRLPVEIIRKVKYLKVEKSGTLFALDNSYGFEKVAGVENRYKLIYGGKEKQLKLPEKSFVAIEFHPLDDDRIVIGFKPTYSDIAENVPLIFKSFQDYASVGVLEFTERLTNSPALRFIIPNVNVGRLSTSGLKVKIHGYDKERKFILPIDISQLDGNQIVFSDIVQVDNVRYSLSLLADPSLANRTQRVYLKQPGEYYVEYVGSNLEPLYIKLPDDLNRYQRGIDSYLIGR
ncbi:MAG: hypothetical protein N2252_01210 [Candidatus Kryptonium sp.]|nr:hypothetical protein [Candidatus Kryptonium sp.]